MKKTTYYVMLAILAVGMTACTTSSRQKMVESMHAVCETLPLPLGHGLIMSEIKLTDAELGLVIDCDSSDCLLSDSILCTEGLITRITNADVDFYKTLYEEGLPLNITYKRCGKKDLTTSLASTQIIEIYTKIQKGLPYKTSLLELTKNELEQLKKQLPRIENESLCLYDAFVRDCDVTFVYIYPDEITKESLALTDEDLREMKKEHAKGLRQSYSLNDLNAFKEEKVVFVYLYITQKEKLCTITVPVAEII